MFIFYIFARIEYNFVVFWLGSMGILTFYIMCFKLGIQSRNINHCISTHLSKIAAPVCSSIHNGISCAYAMICPTEGICCVVMLHRSSNNSGICCWFIFRFGNSLLWNISGSSFLGRISPHLFVLTLFLCVSIVVLFS